MTCTYQAAVHFKLNPHVSAENTHMGIKKFSLFPHKGGLYRDLMRDLSGSLLTNPNPVIPWNPKRFVGWQGRAIPNPRDMTKAEAAPKPTHQLPRDLPRSQMPCWEFFPDTVAYGLCIAIWRARDGQKQSGEGGKRMTRQPRAYVCCLVIRWCLNASLALRQRKILTQRKPWCNCTSCNAVRERINLSTCFLGFGCVVFLKTNANKFFSLHVVRKTEEQFRIIFK